MASAEKALFFLELNADLMDAFGGLVSLLAMIVGWQIGPPIYSTWFHIWFSTLIGKALMFKISIIALL